MRFSIVFIIFALFAPILAVPVPGKDGKGASSSSSGSGKQSNPPASEPKPKVAANTGDVVMVQGKHFMEGNAGGTSDTKSHPAIVVDHNPDTHYVKVVPLSHKPPKGVPTVPTHELGIPGSTLVSVDKPKTIHQNNILKDIGPSPAGKVGLPEKLNDEQMANLHHALGNAGAVRPPGRESEKKDKGKMSRRELEERNTDWAAQGEYYRRFQCRFDAQVA